MCACLKLDRAEVTSQRTCLHMSVNAVFFLRSIHPVRLQCDIREIYGYFSRMRTNIRAVCVPGLPFRRRPGNNPLAELTSCCRPLQYTHKLISVFL